MNESYTRHKYAIEELESKDMSIKPVLFFGYDIVMSFVSAFVAFIVSYQAYRAHTITRKKSFLALELGFIFTGIGLLADSILSYAAIASRIPHFFGVGYLAYFISTMIGYALILGSYIIDRVMMEEAVPAMVPIARYGSLPESILLILIGVVMIQSMINLLMDRSLNKLLIAAAFTSIFLSHLCFMIQALAFASLLVIGQILRFIGFMMFAVFIIRVVRAG